MAGKKPPKPFRKPLKPKKYQRKLRKRIFLEPDRAFLDDITTSNDDGRVVLGRELSKDELAKLKKLRKEARKNRGAVRTGRLVILAVIVGAVLVFNILFRDRLVEQGAERLLETIFLAKADMTGVSFRPFKGEISFANLTIADAEAPLQNLVELSSGTARIDTWQLFNRRVLIDELAAEGLQFGTPREESGALEPSRRAGGDEEQAGAADGPGLADRLAGALPAVSFADLGLPDTLDAEAFLQANLDGLQTPVAVETIANQATGFVDRWRGELDALTVEITAAATSVQTFATTDFTAIRTVDAALAVYDDASEIQATVTGIAGRIETQYNQLVAEATGIYEATRALPSQVTADYNELVGRIPDIRTEGRDFIVGLVEPYVQQALGAWYQRILRGYEIYERVTAERERRPPRAGRDPGVDFDFERTAYPRFLLTDGRLGVGAAGAETLSVQLSNVTSDPEIVGAPTVINYDGVAQAGRLVVEAVLDGRETAQTTIDLAINTSDTPLAVNRGLEAIGLASVTGVMDVAAELRQQGPGVFDGSLGLSARNIQTAGDYAENSIGEFLADVLTRAESLQGAFGFTMADAGNVRFTSGETNLDDVVADAVRERVEATIARFKEELNDRVAAFLDPQIEALTARLDGIVEIETSAEELLALARDREAAAAELERIAQDSINSIRDRLEAEAQRALDAAKAEAEARAQAVIDQAEEEARRAAEEAEAQARSAAEEAAEDAVDSIRDRFRLPGGL